MKPLIDADILLHEIGWSGEFQDKETGDEILFDFDRVAEILDDKINLINYESEGDEPPTLFITDNPTLNARMNKERAFFGQEPIEYVPGFRYNLAKTKPYKGNRKNPKPYHFYNLISYMRHRYDTVVATGGLEADDVICQHQTDNTVICSRDKDLRIQPGLHYSWECGKQRSIGPVKTDRIGWLEKDEKGKTLGYGLSFFYYQMLAGDSADNIPGCPKIGDVKAFKLLNELKTEEGLFQTVKAAYKEAEMDKEYFMEQANLLWMRGDGPYVFPKI